MISKFDDHFNKLLIKINSNNKFILGLSGGIDSMALLHLIKNFKDDKRNVSIDCMPIIIDHNLEIIKASDYIIDLGPYGGNKGGEIVFQGDIDKFLKSETLTAINLKKVMN